MPGKVTMVMQLSTATSDPGAAVKRIGGWSESWYDQRDYSSGAVITVARQEFEVLCQKRAALLPIGASIIAQRYQAVSPLGPSTTIKKVFPGASGVACDVPQMGLFFSQKAAAVRNARPTKLKGIPDSIIVEGEYKPTSKFQSDFLAFAQEIEGWNMRAQSLSVQTSPIWSIASNGAFVLEEGDATLAAGNMVQVLRTTTTGKVQVGGKFLIQVMVSATEGTLRDWPHGACKGGKMRKFVEIFPELQFDPNTTPIAIVAKVGRPTLGYRGRASRRKS